METPSARLPPQVGTSSLLSFYRCSSTAVPGLLLVLLAPRAYAVSLALGVVSCAGGIMLAAYALKHFLRAVTERPSDILFSPDRVRVDRGPFHGLEMTAGEVPSAFMLEEIRETRTTLRGILWVSLLEIPLLFLSPFIIIIVFIGLFGVPVGIILVIVLFFAILAAGASYGISAIVSWLRRAIKRTESPPSLSRIWGTWSMIALKLHLKRPVSVFRIMVKTSRGAKIIAESDHPDEQKSLRLLYETLKNFQGRNEPKPVPVNDSIPLSCAGCGAPLAPADAELVPCPYCREETAVPPDMRDRVRAASRVAGIRGLSAALLKRLLDQPHAGLSAQRLFRGGCVLLAVWPLTALPALWLNAGDSMDFNTGWAMAAGASLLTCGIFFLVQARLSDRQALRIMTLEFGSIPPDKEGGAHLCRSCGAPLPFLTDAHSVR